MNRDLSGADQLLADVATFNLHPHLPYLHVPPEVQDRVDVLARQPINPAAARHPFTAAGNRSFNALLRVRPEGCPGWC